MWKFFPLPILILLILRKPSAKSKLYFYKTADLSSSEKKKSISGNRWGNYSKLEEFEKNKMSFF